MCGICGVFGRRDEETVQAMLQAIHHRGPDDEHLVSGDHFVIGARRLSIVDLDGGRQPIGNEDGSIWGAQNGEIYNYPALRNNLLSKGHVLKTRCDTEVLAHLYEDCSVDYVNQIEGMFATAVWDDNEKIGILSRDRTGKKPLYYCHDQDALYFGSEIKCLLHIPNFKREIHLEALYHFFSLKHVPHPLSIFKGIHSLPPAHKLIYTLDHSPAISRYWKMDFSPMSESDLPSEEEAIQTINAMLHESVNKRLMSDVPIGFFLSGGLDSSLTTAIASQEAGERIKTFTLTYSHESTTPGKEEDKYWASWVAKKYGTEHYEEQIDFGYFPDTVQRILQCFDEPFSGVVSTFFLSRLISKHVKTSISGDGADELFGSYLSHRIAVPLHNYPEYLSTGDANLIKPFETQTDLLARLYESEEWAWRYKLLVMKDDEKDCILSPEVKNEIGANGSKRLIKSYFQNGSAKDPMNRILEAEFSTIFPDQVLAFTDRLSMAHSLEVRAPYLDTDLISYVAKLPGNLKLKNHETKYLLKKVGERYFPSEMVYRKKEGFLMPITQWILQDLEDYVRDTLHPDRLNKHSLFQTEEVQSMVNRLYSGKVDYTHVNPIFSLVMFQEWHNLYMR